MAKDKIPLAHAVIEPGMDFSLLDLDEIFLEASIVYVDCEDDDE